MKMLMIRHGDPDYTIDSLTEKGWREAEYLAEMLAGQEIAAFYSSPLGRARDTASRTLAKLGREAEIMPWLREFEAPIDRPDDTSRKHIPWDWLPQDWTEDPRLYRKDHWFENEAMAAGKVKEEYDRVTGEFDALIARHGYRREGGYYRVEKPNHDTIALFCHFGCGAVLLSHLMGVSPMIPWHHFCAAPSSVTTVATEERRKGIAVFRMHSYGETTHLYMNGEPPAFSARFCECYEDDTRHD
jgi:probable phosphoglycerate mutase